MAEEALLIFIPMVKILGYPALAHEALCIAVSMSLEYQIQQSLLVAACVAALSFNVWDIEVFIYELLVEFCQPFPPCSGTFWSGSSPESCHLLVLWHTKLQHTIEEASGFGQASVLMEVTLVGEDGVQLVSKPGRLDG